MHRKNLGPKLIDLMPLGKMLVFKTAVSPYIIPKPNLFGKYLQADPISLALSSPRTKFSENCFGQAGYLVEFTCTSVCSSLDVSAVCGPME